MHLQDLNFNRAYDYCIALDKRNGEQGKRIFDLATVARNNLQYDIAIDSKGSFCSIFTIISDFVPLIQATNVLFLHLPFLLVTKVYNSPCDKDTSSILKCSPIFSGNIM